MHVCLSMTCDQNFLDSFCYGQTITTNTVMGVQQERAVTSVSHYAA